MRLLLDFGLLGLLVGANAHAEDAPPQRKHEAYTLHLKSSKPGTLEIELETRGGYHLNDDYPLHFVPKPSTDVHWSKARVERQDGMELWPCRGAEAKHMCSARVTVGYKTTKSAGLRLGGTMAFSACDAERCLIEKVALSTVVDKLP